MLGFRSGAQVLWEGQPRGLGGKRNAAPGFRTDHCKMIRTGDFPNQPLFAGVQSAACSQVLRGDRPLLPGIAGGTSGIQAVAISKKSVCQRTDQWSGPASTCLLNSRWNLGELTF